MVDEPEEQGERDAPSLEPPSLFRRRPKPPKPPRPARTPATPPAPPAVEPAAQPAAQPVAEPEPAPAAAPEPAPVPTPVVRPPAPAPRVVQSTPAPEPVATPAESPEPRAPWLAGRLSGRLAAVVAGLVVAALLIAATAASLRVCDAVRGTDTCGGSGYLFLIAILVVSVLVGAALLNTAGVPDATSTAMLAVGLVSVFALVFLVGHLLAWWMVIVIPLVSVGAFVLSHWVTTSLVDPDPDSGPGRR